MDFQSLIDQAKQTISQSTDDLVKTGLPVLEASLEDQAIKQLTQQKNATQDQLNKNVAAIQARPSSAFGDSMNSVLKNLGLNQGGGMILAGVAAVAVVMYFVMKK